MITGWHDTNTLHRAMFGDNIAWRFSSKLPRAMDMTRARNSTHNAPRRRRRRRDCCFPGKRWCGSMKLYSWARAMEHKYSAQSQRVLLTLVRARALSKRKSWPRIHEVRYRSWKSTLGWQKRVHARNHHHRRPSRTWWRRKSFDDLYFSARLLRHISKYVIYFYIRTERAEIVCSICTSARAK